MTLKDCCILTYNGQLFIIGQPKNVIILFFRYGPNNNGNSDVYFWICLYQTTPSMNATTYWLDGNPSTWRDWYQGEPDGNSSCMSGSNFYQWGDWSCTSNQFYVCKMPAREYIKAKFSIADLIYAKSKIRKSRFYLKSKILAFGFLISILEFTCISENLCKL